jgi:uncharacterized protein YcfL
MKPTLLSLAIAATLAAGLAAADTAPASGGAASKLVLRGDAQGIKVVEMRLVRKNDMLVVQADLQNTSNNDRQIFYRFRWLDSNGNQVGDGETFKQVGFMGQQLQTLKGIAPQPNASDFRLEMNVETK